MTIIAGLFNFFEPDKLNIIKYLNYISCILSAYFVGESKIDFYEMHSYGEVILITYILIVISVIVHIKNVYNVTINLKTISYDFFANLIEVKKITYLEAFSKLSNNEFITQNKKSEIKYMLEKKYNLLSDLEKEQDKKRYISESVNQTISLLKRRK